MNRRVTTIKSSSLNGSEDKLEALLKEVKKLRSTVSDHEERIKQLEEDWLAKA